MAKKKKSLAIVSDVPVSVVEEETIDFATGESTVNEVVADKPATTKKEKSEPKKEQTRAEFVLSLCKKYNVVLSESELAAVNA